MSFDLQVQTILGAMDRDLADVRCNGDQLRRETENSEAIWKHQVHALPVEVARLLGSIDLCDLRIKALAQIEQELFGWNNRYEGNRALDTASVRATWRSALRENRRATIIPVVRHVIDDTKHVAQIQKLEFHEFAPALPPWQRYPRVQGGVLYTRDVTRGMPTFGVRSYPEATPVEVPVFVTRLWMKRTRRYQPACWDLTAGSGTVHDVVTAVFKGRVAGTDIALDNRTTVFGDIRDAGSHPRHARQMLRLPGYRAPKDVVSNPDLVFIHPPSRGWPACCWVYGREKERARELDLGVLLERREYVQVIAHAVRTSMEHLAEGGLVSLVIPEYLRLHQEVVPDPGIADALLLQVQQECVLVARHAVVDEQPVKQTSLGTNRGPVSHLILAKKVAA